MVLIENQLKLLHQVKEFHDENDNKRDALRARLYKSRRKMLEEQAEISKIDRDNQLLRVMCFGKK